MLTSPNGNWPSRSLKYVVNNILNTIVVRLLCVKDHCGWKASNMICLQVLCWFFLKSESPYIPRKFVSPKYNVYFIQVLKMAIQSSSLLARLQNAETVPITFIEINIVTPINTSVSCQPVSRWTWANLSRYENNWEDNFFQSGQNGTVIGQIFS